MEDGLRRSIRGQRHAAAGCGAFVVGRGRRLVKVVLGGGSLHGRGGHGDGRCIVRDRTKCLYRVLLVCAAVRPSRHVALGTMDATHLTWASHGEEVFILRHGGEQRRRSDRICLRNVCVDREVGATARWVAIRVSLIIVVVVVFCARKLPVYTEVNTGVAIGEASRGADADACPRDWVSNRREGLARSKYRGPK